MTMPAPLRPDGHTPEVGQIWREVDTRFVRFVQVREVASHGRSILIRTVVPVSSGGWEYKPRSRAGWAAVERFNGKHGGYAFVSAAIARAEPQP